jgi:hypothetical protein
MTAAVPTVTVSVIAVTNMNIVDANRVVTDYIVGMREQTPV